MPGVNGNATGRTQAGRPYRSRPRDCRTVRVRHPGKPMLPDCPHSRQRQAAVQPEKPLEWHYDQPGPDASISTNRPPLRNACRLRSRNLAQTSGKARRARSSLRGRGAVSQETCHPQESHLSEGSPDPGRDTPDASTEVVMALLSRSPNGPFCIAALFRSRVPLACIFPGAR